MFNPVDHLEDHLHGDKFANCEFHWNDNSQRLDGIGSRHAIVFCKTDYLQDFFKLIRDNGKKYILLTHNSDYNIDEERYSWKPANVLMWFGQNVVINKPNLIPIPIGMERPHINPVSGSGNVADFHANLTGHWVKSSHVYLNWNNRTNPGREAIQRYFQQTGFATERCNDRIPMRHYLEAVRSHYFNVCPPGNGSDTHRLWETLYCGSIPICEANFHNRVFAKILPMVLYTDIHEITLELLLKKRDEIADKLKRNLYTLRALRFSFWRDLIHYYGKHLLK